MNNFRLAACIALLFAVFDTPAGAETAFILGDSHGVSLADVSHLPSVAHIGDHIRGPRAVEQIKRIPTGSVAFLSLGTNDANGSIENLDKSIEDILSAASNKKLKLVWIGPPCVRQSWDTRSRDLDKRLRERLASTDVIYVNMRDDSLCSGSMHEPDGVHFKMNGYAYIWKKVGMTTFFESAFVNDVANKSDITASIDRAIERRRAASAKIELTPKILTFVVHIPDPSITR
jgi:hypothetical protein